MTEKYLQLCELCGDETRATRAEDELKIAILIRDGTEQACCFTVCEDCYDDAYLIKEGDIE